MEKLLELSCENLEKNGENMKILKLKPKANIEAVEITKDTNLRELQDFLEKNNFRRVSFSFSEKELIIHYSDDEGDIVELAVPYSAIIIPVDDEILTYSKKELAEEYEIVEVE